MTHDPHFFDEWRAADKAASAAERDVSDAFMRHFNGAGEAPSTDKIIAAKTRRAVADGLLAVAMDRVENSREGG
jgi:hypothetical protein